jgi:hypothetical protein
MTRVRLGEVMVNQGLLTEAQVETILEHQRERPRPFGHLAEVLFHVSAEDVESAWVEQYSRITERVNPLHEEIDPEVVAMVSRRQAWQFRLMPVRWDGSEVMVATVREHLTRGMRFALRQLAAPCWFVLADAGDLGAALSRHYAIPGMDASMITASGFAVDSAGAGD